MPTSNWSITLSTRLRLYIGDVAAPLTYSQLQLAQFIAIAAIQVANEVSLGNTYAINTDIPTISPDPITVANNGEANLFVMKAACLIGSSELRRDVSKFGFKVKDHLTEFDGREGMKARVESSKNFCELYVAARHQWKLGNRAAGRAIMGPYTSAISQRFAGQHMLDWDDGSLTSRVL